MGSAGGGSSPCRLSQPRFPGECFFGTPASALVWSGGATSPGPSIAPRGRIPRLPPCSQGCASTRWAARIWPAPGSHGGAGAGAADRPGCGAAAERGQRGMGRERARSHEKLPPPSFRQDRGRGNSRTRRASARPRSRFKELPWSLVLAGPGLRAAGDNLQGVPVGLSPLWVYPSCCACHVEGAQPGAWQCPGGDVGVPTSARSPSHRGCHPASPSLGPHQAPAMSTAGLGALWPCWQGDAVASWTPGWGHQSPVWHLCPGSCWSDGPIPARQGRLGTTPQGEGAPGQPETFCLHPPPQQHGIPRRGHPGGT